MILQELSIGDWVAVDGKPYRVMSINGVTGLITLAGKGNPIGMGAIEAIPITPEILEKNGWLPPRNAIALDTWWWTNGVDKAIEADEYEGEWYLTIIEQKEIQYRNRVGIGLKYVHQLQHALRLAGVEEDITLCKDS